MSVAIDELPMVHLTIKDEQKAGRYHITHNLNSSDIDVSMLVYISDLDCWLDNCFDVEIVSKNKIMVTMHNYISRRVKYRITDITRLKLKESLNECTKSKTNNTYKNCCRS